MNDFDIFLLIGVVVMILTMLINPKLRIIPIILEQFRVYRNFKTNKPSFYDFITFLVAPILVAIILVLNFDYTFDLNISNVLITVFSIIFTLLFGFATLLISRTDTPSNIEKRVIGETFISIMSCMLTSLFAAVFLIVLSFNQLNAFWTKSLTVTVVYLGLHCLALLLMITKRIFIIFSEKTKN